MARTTQRVVVILSFFLFWQCHNPVLSFTTNQNWWHRVGYTRTKVAVFHTSSPPPPLRRHDVISMRDMSASYWFQVGQTVRVVEDVPKAGTNLKGRQGIVMETWEKCDVDPTCCCAEQVDLNMAVRVQFTNASHDDSSSLGPIFEHYFAETELVKVEELPSATNDGNGAFDGMSCTAFKLDQLKMGQQAQKRAAFEAERARDNH